MTDRLVIVIVGPTAVGKTKLGVELAKKIGGEVISGDSMQIYRHMDIATAKVTKEEMEGIKHYCIDIKDIHENYSVLEFQKNVRECIEHIHSQNKIPIIVGGTGLYIKAALYDYTFSDEKDGDDHRYDALTNEELYTKLKLFDPESANTIHPNNRRRVLRAIEIYEKSGQKKSEILEKQEHRCLFNAVFIGLTLPRELLYERINFRVDKMMQEGLYEEFQKLIAMGATKEDQGMKAIGYKEWFDLENVGKPQVVELIKQHSRQYAKRQYTWFKNQMDLHWIQVNLEDFNETVKEALAYIEDYKYFKYIAFTYHFEDLSAFCHDGILDIRFVYCGGEKTNPTLYELKTQKYHHQTLIKINFDIRKVDAKTLKKEYEAVIGKECQVYTKKDWQMPGIEVSKMIEIKELNKERER